MVTAAEKQGNYEETQVVLQETVHIFSQKNDVQAVRDSGRAITELHTVTELRHKEMLESIKELSGSLTRAKQEHNEREKTLLDPTHERQLLAERSRIEENIRRLTAETEGLKQRIAAADGKAIELSAQEQRLRQQETVEVKRARHTISLYANISSIRWDYSNSNVKGWVTSASGGAGAGAGGAGMRAFEMEANRHTDFQVTNFLWDLMDAV